MLAFNFEYICGDIVRNITVSYNLVNLTIALLLLIFVLTAIFRKLNWIITVLVILVLLGAAYFVTLNIETKMGCQGSTAYKFEYYPSWWKGFFN